MGVFILSAMMAVMVLGGCGEGKKTASDSSASSSKSESEATSDSSASSSKSESEATSDSSASSSESASEAASGSSASSSSSASADSQNTDENGPKATIVVKDYGTIELVLDEKTAPITVANFVKLAKDGFYDGLTFHRVITGFMIQGGDPKGNGTGGSEETIKGEFKSNGVENNISHTRGTISMARSQDKDSASSQFFIMQADSDYLDGDYAAFGHVTSGIEVVDKICENTKVEDENGTVKTENQPVIESITILE